MIATALSFLAATVAASGPLAWLAGAPLGAALTWLGGRSPSRTIKVVAIGVGVLVLVTVTAGLTVHVQHLERDRIAYRALSVEVQSLADAYGCAARPEAERALASCLSARERDAERARAEELSRQRLAAAKAQQQLDRDNAAADAASATEQAAIRQSPPADDGPVPRVLLDSWARKRSERGLK